MQIDNDIIEFIKDQLLVNTNVSFDDVANIVQLSKTDGVLYNLLVTWMKTIDITDKFNIYQDMVYRKDYLLNNKYKLLH